MKLTGDCLTRITEAAFVNIRELAKLPDETHEEFLGRAWYLAFESAIKKDGYEIGLIDSITGATIVCELANPIRRMQVSLK